MAQQSSFWSQCTSVNTMEQCEVKIEQHKITMAEYEGTIEQCDDTMDQCEGTMEQYVDTMDELCWQNGAV